MTKSQRFWVREKGSQQWHIKYRAGHGPKAEIQGVLESWESWKKITFIYWINLPVTLHWKCHKILQLLWGFPPGPQPRRVNAGLHQGSWGLWPPLVLSGSLSPTPWGLVASHASIFTLRVNLALRVMMVVFHLLGKLSASPAFLQGKPCFILIFGAG